MHNFELAHLKKKNEKHFCCLVTFWFSTFTILFRATRSLVSHETLKDEWCVVTYKGFKVYHCEIALYCDILHVRAIPIMYRVYQLYGMGCVGHAMQD